MSRSPRYPEPTPELIAERQQIVRMLTAYSLGQVPVTVAEVKAHLEPLLNLAEHGGEIDGVRVPPVIHFPAFAPHIRAAADARDWPLLAAWTLALVLIANFEQHMPDYAASIRGKQANARESAAKRLGEGNNTLTRIEVWERGEGHKLLRGQKDRIALCAAAIKRSIATVEDALYRRERVAKEL